MSTREKKDEHPNHKAAHQNEVREGQETSSIHGDPDKRGRHEYPYPRPVDSKYRDQPEFTEPESGNTDEKLEQEQMGKAHPAPDEE